MAENNSGLKTLYAGRAMTMWNTREEAEASWRAPNLSDLWERTAFTWWRASTVEVVECPADVSLTDVLKKDFASERRSKDAHLGAVDA